MRFYFIVLVLFLLITSCGERTLNYEKKSYNKDDYRAININNTNNISNTIKENNGSPNKNEVNGMFLKTDFENNQLIPEKFTCDGINVSPHIEISGVPEGTKSLVLIMDDPDAPVGVWDHWVVFNIPPDTRIIPEGRDPPGVSGINSWGRSGYGGPCPPDGEHRYFFKIYALDTILDLPEGATKDEIMKYAEGHIIDRFSIIGRYARK